MKRRAFLGLAALAPFVPRDLVPVAPMMLPVSNVFVFELGQTITIPIDPPLRRLGTMTITHVDYERGIVTLGVATE